MIRNPVEILLSLPAVFLALSFHEFAHAFVAYRMGDPTPKYRGRLTLDPFAHVDWIGLLMFAVFGFGWARPVEVNPSNFKNRRWGDILVSLAGPLGNMFLAVIAIFAKVIIIKLIPVYILRVVINYVVWLNVVFALLNLVPIPPFDGYHIIKRLFFRRNVKFFWNYEKYSIWVLFAFIFLGLFRYIVGIPAGYIYDWLRELESIFALLF